MNRTQQSPSSCLHALLFLGLLPWFAAELPAQDAVAMKVAIDATDLPRKLLRARVTIPVQSAESHPLTIPLWYPKWVPGSHGPGGPVQNVAGMVVSAQDAGGTQTRLAWRREVGEVHRILVEIPDSAEQLLIDITYITNQPTATSMGHDSFGSALLGIISPTSALIYPEAADIDRWTVQATLQLPGAWKASSALPVSWTSADTVTFAPVSLRTFADSPIMCGLHRRTYELVDGNAEGIPPHRLHIFSEAESVLDLPPVMLQRFHALVVQAARLFRSHPFDQFDILLATTDLLPRNGLEHSRSSLNVLGQRTLQEPDELKGWDRLLVPHEFVHAWCGKYRRPVGMVQPDFHSPKDTELLWVYEGLTQYLGELIEVRAGWMSPEEFQHRLEVEIRAALHQQGRNWRSLADTGSCSHILREGSSFWGRLRRSQDYYMEGMLFWLEADALIRQKSLGERSLDDFCHRFFHHDKASPHPSPFDRSTVVHCLNEVLEYDWEGLIRRRIESVSDRFDPEVATLLGFAIQYSHEPPRIPHETFRRVAGVDAVDSLGAVFDANGTIKDVLLDSPAYRSKLGPGMKVVGVNGQAWSENRMRDAISMSANRGFVELLIVSGDSFETVTIPYDGGPRYMRLMPGDGKEEGLIPRMVQPLSG